MTRRVFSPRFWAMVAAIAAVDTAVAVLILRVLR